MLGLALQIAQVAVALCPDPARHETKSDCPWAVIAREAGSGPELAAAAPALWRDIGRDASARALHAAWGQSRNFDEHERKPIVDAALLAAIGRRLGVPGDGEVVHAGLQHTYGYLFSTLWTAFGYKRARWVDGELERGLGLSAGMLGPTPPSGTLYANVTCTLAALVFDKGAPSGCPVLHARVHEGLRETSGDTTLRTDWFALGAHRWLLVYSAKVGNVEQLLTSFPVDDGMIASVRTGLLDDAAIVARYNAVVPSLAAGARGSRRVVHVAP